MIFAAVVSVVASYLSREREDLSADAGIGGDR